MTSSTHIWAGLGKLLNMGTKKLFIKNMVCDRCKMAVHHELEKANIKFRSIELGEVELTEEPTAGQLQNFKSRISELGFELIEDKTARVISSIKNAIIEFVRGKVPDSRRLKFSAYLAEKLNKDYNYLSSL